MSTLCLRNVIPEKTFDLFRELIYRTGGIRVVAYKNGILANRLKPRLQKLGIDTWEDYYQYILAKGDKEELLILLDMVTTNVTSFFREERQFDFLKTTVLPEIVEAARKTGERRIRLWSAGCSSGEEAYSLAIVLMEELPDPRSWDVKILASDISVMMLEKAAQGVYPVKVIEQMPAGRHRFFQREGAFSRVKPQIADLAVFRRINLIESRLPVRAQFDVIFCRNVIIYFDRATQRRVLKNLTDCLKAGGYLFMGHAESLRNHADLVKFVGPNIYRKTG